MVAQRNADGRVEVGFTAEAMEVKQLIESVAQIAMMVPIEAAQGLVDEYHRAATLTPLFDPTGWMRVQANAVDHMKLAKAFLAFRRAVAEVAEEEGRPRG